MGFGTKAFALVSVSMVALSGTAGWAQGSPASEAAADSTRLEEIVVTAQRREQNLQEVPVAVTAFSAAGLERAGITSVKELSQADSALTLIGASQMAVAFVRGVGSPATLPGNEQSVAFYIDDVYYTRMTTAFLSLNNIERTEVLKGPQGTLFGRNASGGLINIITRSPDRDKMALEATVGYGNFDTVTGKLYASTPLGDRAAIDISASYQNESKGWGRNLFTGNRVWKDRYLSLRSKLVADITDTTKATLIGYYVDSRSPMGFVFGVHRNSIGGEAAYSGDTRPRLQSDIGFYNLNVNFDPRGSAEGYGGSLKLEQDLGGLDLVSISAYRKGTDDSQYAGKNSIYPFLAYRLHGQDRQYSQELQFKSQQGSAFDWILGLYYLNSRSGFSPGLVFGDAFGVGSSGPLLNDATLGAYLNIRGIQTVKSYSGFGQATFHVIPDGTNVTLGLRYTVDKLHGRGDQIFTVGGVSFPLLASMGGQDPFDMRQTFKKLTYKVALDHKFTDDVLGYVSVSRGFKSGVFNTLPLLDVPTRPEVVTAYEAGLKTELFDRRLRLNLAVYQNDIEDLQVQVIRTINGIGNVSLQNAATARARGVELEGQAVLAEGLMARFGINYLDAKYREFMDAPFFAQDPNPFYGNIQFPGNAKGNRLTQSPKLKFNGGLNYNLKSAIGEFDFAANVTYTGRYFWGPDNVADQRKTTLVNGSIAYHYDEHLGVRFWANNITKVKYYTQVLLNFGENGNSAAPAAPRTYGVELSYKF